jgi:hypothetical protein
MDPLRIVLGNGSAGYLQGGGHWIIRVQYMLGLRALGHHPILLDLLCSSGNHHTDEAIISSFFNRLEEYGLKECGALLLLQDDKGEQNLEASCAYGKSMLEIKEIIRSADLLWNDCCAIRQPLLGMFRHRVLMDLDPGHLQVSALTADQDIQHHQVVFTIGKKMHDADCEVPTLDLHWRTCTPFVYMPLWQVTADPGPNAAFTSVTHWTWGGELWWQDRLLSVSKRDAYLRYIELPQRVRRPFEIAAQIEHDDDTGDRENLERHGWRVVHPWEVAGSPEAYQHYIGGSRAEISCPKPIFRELKTGWFSDRSVCYLASGRPVLAEDTGFTDYLPTGKGLVAFRDMEEAVAGVVSIDSDYHQHARAARALAEEFFDSRRCLTAILDACG